MNETDAKNKMIMDIIDLRSSLIEAMAWCKRHKCDSSCPIYECCEGSAGKNVFDRITTLLDDTEKIVKGN